ncbi:MAG: hypothetical protein ACRBN8_16130 [Nannocystales bacterium]
MSTQNSLRLVSGEDGTTSPDEWVADVVFLCAEDDDLELVSVVHRAREERIAVEVLPGVDRDAEGILDSLDGLERDACVLFCSKGYAPSDALGFRQRFQSRYPNDELVVMELDKTRVDALVELLVRRIVLLRSSEPSGVQALPLSPEEPSSDVRPVVSEPVEFEEPEPAERRSKLPLLLGGVVVSLGLLFVGWQMSTGDESAETRPAGVGAAPAAEAAVALPGTPSEDPDSVAAVVDPAEQEEVSANLALVRETLGADNPALKALPEAQVDAAAAIISAASADSPCPTLRAAKDELETSNESLLALVLAADIETPEGCSSAGNSQDENADAKSEAAAVVEPRRRGRRSRSRTRNQGTAQAESPEPAVAETKPEPKKADPKPQAAPTSKPRARLIDDGLIHTTE